MTTTRLQIGLADGRAFTLPTTETTTSTIVVYGGKGMGKTNFGAVLVEELIRSRQRVCFLDPVGVAWGVRHSANGKGEGVKLLILGGRHGDLPIEPTGGAVVADFVATASESILIDISARADGSHWSIPEKIRFVGEYVARLLQRHTRDMPPMLQIIDEAARFAPQMMRQGAKESQACLEAIEAFVEEGRNAGLGIVLLTQRSARLAKSVAELAELMVAFRTIGPNSVDAILDWFGEHVPKERWKALVEDLRRLPRGSALIVSPGWLEYEGVAQMRLRHTFDSSKTPSGTEKRLSGRVRPANLEKLRAAIAATVEKAEASDPSKLRTKLQALERQVDESRKEAAQARERLALEQAKPKATRRGEEKASKLSEIRMELAQHRRALEEAMKILVKVKAVDFSVDTDEDRRALEHAVAAAVRQVTGPIEKRVTSLVARVEGIKQQASTAATAIAALLDEKIDLTVQVERREPYAVSTPAVRTPAPRAVTPRPVPDGPAGEDPRLVNAKGIKKHVSALLAALAQHPEGRTREQAVILAGYVPSGDISTAFAGLLDRGLVGQVGNLLRITPEGLAFLGPFEPLPTGAALRTYLLERLSSAERKILGALFDADRTPQSRVQLHEAAGLKPSGDTSTAFGKFFKLGWAEERDGGIVAADLFFEE